MKKIYFFLLLSFVTVNLVTAQTSIPVVFNFRDLAAYDAAHPQIRAFQERNEWDDAIPKSFPTPPGAIVRTQVLPNIPLTNNPTSVSPSPSQSFLGVLDLPNSIPPDTHGCVGPNHVITYSNDLIVIHNKVGGAVISSMNTNTFAGVANAAGDPYMKYDPVANRFIAIGFTYPPSGSNRIYVNISNTSDPTGTWTRYNLQPAVSNTNVFWDHPFMGFDSRFIVVNGNQFSNTTNQFLGSGLVFMDKATMLAGQPLTNGVNTQTLETLGAGTGGSPCPVTVYGTNPSTDFNIIQSWNGTSIRLTKVSGNIPNLVWNIPAAVFPTAPAGQNWQPAGGQVVQQAGESRKIECNGEINCAVMVNQNIWCVHAIGFPATGTINSLAAQWWQVSPAGAVVQRGRVGGAPGEYRFYPSIAVNANESALIGYTYSSVNSTVSAAYSTRCLTTAPNTTDDEFVYKTGLATYWKDYNSGRARWGDYSHTSLDPVDGSLWTVQEYAAARVGTGDNASRYGIWWAQVQPANCTIQRDAAVSAIVEPYTAPAYCNLPIVPKVVIRNLGLDTLRNVQVGMILDGTFLGTQTFNNINLLTLGSLTVTLSPSLNPIGGGAHTFKAFTLLPNGQPDQRPNNDTATVTFSVLQTLPLPNVEGFENPTFPPPGGWAVFNPDGAATWIRTTANKLTGVASMKLAAYNYSARKQIDILQSPKLDITALDSLKISFDVAYAPYNATGFIDTLEVVYSLDCGQTWLPTGYKKWASLTVNPTALNTAPPQAGEFFPTLASQWRNDKVNMPICGIASPSMLIGVKWINNYGNDVYIDNLTFTGVNSKQRNTGVTNISSPFGTLCDNTFTPIVTISNYGTDPLTTATINYSVDGGPLTSFNFTGNLAKCSTAVITLSPVTTTAGNHVFTAYTTLPNGGTDQYVNNDTLSKSFIVSSILKDPIVEGFETPLFPPNGWNVVSPNPAYTWQRTTAIGSKSSASMVVNNFNNPAAAGTTTFFSPVVINKATIDSFYVSFDYAYSPGFQYPGATAFPLDTLELQVTTDCGKTFTTIYKKWGQELSTLPDPTGINNSNNVGYTPQQQTEWRNVRLYLTPTVGASNFQVYFVSKGNKQNNLYVDNINISSKTLPAKLKNQGYVLYPVPFTTSFKIHHYIAPVDLQTVGVYNSVGQLVWKKDLNGMGNTEEFVDLSNMAPGVYEVKLTYSNKTIVERIVKMP